MISNKITQSVCNILIFYELSTVETVNVQSEDLFLQSWWWVSTEWVQTCGLEVLSAVITWNCLSCFEWLAWSHLSYFCFVARWALLWRRRLLVHLWHCKWNLETTFKSSGPLKFHSELAFSFPVSWEFFVSHCCALHGFKFIHLVQFNQILKKSFTHFIAISPAFLVVLNLFAFVMFH